MKIVVGGATSAGKSIVAYLSMGNNDIVVVDEDASTLDDVAKLYDVQPVLGSISNPDVQQSVGMNTADMLIAVTDSDEVNLIACQVAYTLFNVPKKIARVDSKYFLNPMWNALYNEKSLPVDLVITPDIEIGKYILNLFEFPGCSAVFPFENNSINIFSFPNKNAESPFTGFAVSHINEKLAEDGAKIVLIGRENKILLTDSETLVLQKNDMVYVCCPSKANQDIMRLFGIDHNPYENVVIFGGNAISYYIASYLEKNDNIISCNIVEENSQNAQKLAELLANSSIITGEAMSDVILEEAGFNSADISVAVTPKDKDNLLLALLAAKNKDTQALSLVNSKDYKLLTGNIRNNTIIDYSLITISSILRYLRKARIEDAYALGHGLGEIWEVRIGDDNTNLHKKIADLHLPQSSGVIALISKKTILPVVANYELQPQDKLIVYVDDNDIRKIENLFYK